MSNTKWLGLWKQERQGFYAGQVIKKDEIPKYTRIVLRYNKYYDKDSSRPRLVVVKIDTSKPEQVDSFPETDRGDNGFGSTGR